MFKSLVSEYLTAAAALTLFLGLSTLTLSVASAQGTGRGPGLSERDKTFAQQADQINMTEARLGEIAQMPTNGGHGRSLVTL
jgi:hypothetical protein